MSTLLSLAPEEVEALADWWAAKIGQGSEAESDMASKRIAQLKRLAAPERRWDIEHLVEDAQPVFCGYDIGAGDDRTVVCVRTPRGCTIVELPTLSHFPEDRKGSSAGPWPRGSR